MAMEIITVESNILGSNTYILKNKNSALIIDAGATLQQLQPHLNDVKVEGVLLTHLHFDHVYELDSYVNEFGCSVYLFDEANVGNQRYTLPKLIGGVKLPQNCYKSLKDVSVLKLNNFKVECFHTPGHTADSMCFKINNNLFSGDTLFFGTVGRTDLPTSSPQQMLNSLNLLNGLEFKTCYSGHGQPSSFEEQKENIKYFLLEL